MNRWNSKLTETPKGKFTLILEPEPNEMSKFMVEASKNLTHQIMEAEEKLVLQCISLSGLKRMIALCEAEIKRRRK